ncbi:MAG: hypothetical protein ACT4OM_03355 [Actinomycetota bacterium]
MPDHSGRAATGLVACRSHVADASAVLAALAESKRHEFWPDDQPFTDVDLRGVVVHRQVTDNYLASLARSRGGRLVTLDRAVTALHPDVAVALANS